MLQAIDPDDRAAMDAFRRVFTEQALALDRIFTRTAIEAASNARFCRDMHLALKAQALCRESYEVLLALPDEGSGDEKFQNRANEIMEG